MRRVLVDRSDSRGIPDLIEHHLIRWPRGGLSFAPVGGENGSWRRGFFTGIPGEVSEPGVLGPQGWKGLSKTHGKELLNAAIDGYKAGGIKHSMAEAIVLSEALEAFHHDTGRYPIRDGQIVSEQLIPKYINTIPTDSFIGRPFSILMTEHGSAVVIRIGRGGFIVKAGEVTEAQPYREVVSQVTR